MYEITGQTLRWVETLCKNKDVADEYISNVKKTRSDLFLKLQDRGIKFIPSSSNWFHVKESDLGKPPDNIIFKNNCTIIGRGCGWVRLQITDNLKDYNWILK